MDEGHFLLDEHQLEAAKHCFLRVLSCPYPPSAFERANILGGMAYYHLERGDWVSAINVCEEPLALLPDARKSQRPSMRDAEAVAGHARGCRRSPGRHDASP